MPSARARSSLAITSAAAPSLIPLALPAVTRAARAEGGLAATPASRPSSPGRGCSSRSSSPTGTSSSAKRAAPRAPPPSGAASASANASWSSRRDVPALGDVLARLAHRLAGIALLVARIDEAPAERRVVERAVAARERRVRLRRHERRPRHRLDAARDEEVAVARDHGVARADDGAQPRGAEPVDRHARDAVGQPGEQRREPRHVAVVLAGLVRAAEPDVLDLGRVDARALDRRGDRERGEVVRAHAGERRRRSGRPASAPRRGCTARRHAASLLGSITRCAIAKAPLAAGTPQ